MSTAPFSLTCKEISTVNRTFDVTVTSDMTVGELRKEIVRSGGPDNVRMVHLGKQVENETSTLASHNITKTSNVVLVRKTVNTYNNTNYGRIVEDKELFDSVRGVNSFSHDTLSFREQFCRAVTLCREVLTGEYSKDDVSVSDVEGFLSHPLGDSKAPSVLHWSAEKLELGACYGEFSGMYKPDVDKKVSVVLKTLLEIVRIIHFDLEKNQSTQFVGVLQSLLNPELTWYAGKWVKWAFQHSKKEGVPEHLLRVRELVDDLGTLVLVREQLPAEDAVQSAWKNTQFDVHVAVLRERLSSAVGAARGEVQEELTSLVQENLEARMSSLVALQEEALAAEAAAEHARVQHQELDSAESKEAWDKAKKEAAAARKQGNSMVGSASVLSLLADNTAAFENEQLSAALQGVLEVLGKSTVSDATNWRWDDGELPDFNSVFEKLGRICSEDDKPRCFRAQLHCILQCWRTDRVPMHQFALKRVRYLGAHEVHKTKTVDGPGVGQTHSDLWDANYYRRPKYEILKVLGKKGEKESPLNSRYTSYSYKPAPIIHMMYEVELRWEHTGVTEVKTMPFFKYQTHQEAVGSLVIKPAEFHQWIDQCQFFEQLFGERYNAYLLNNEGKAFIEYLAKHNQLLAHHAEEMLNRLGNARSQYERDEVKELILKLLKDMDGSGQVAILDTIGHSLEPKAAADLLLSNDAMLWHRNLSGYNALMSFVQCSMAVLQKLPPPYDQMETLNSLCVEVMTVADDSKPGEEEEEHGPPLRIVLVEQCVAKIAGVLLEGDPQGFEVRFAQSRASSGLLHMILTRSAGSERELSEMLELTNQAVAGLDQGWQTVTMLISELTAVAQHSSILPEHFSSRLMPRLTLIKLLINVGGMRDSLLVADMETLLQTFAALNRLEMLLLWFSQLKLDGHPEGQQLLNMLFEWAADASQMVTSQGFQGFKQLFLKVNAAAFGNSSSGSAKSAAITKELGGCVTSLDALTGVPALWEMVLHGNQEVMPLARELLLKIYFSLTLSVDQTHKALLDEIFQHLQPNGDGSQEASITKVAVKSVEDDQDGNVRFGTKCSHSNGDKTMVWHRTAQWEQFLNTQSAPTLDFTVSDSAVCQALDQAAKALLSSSYAEMHSFLSSGDGELNRKPSGGIASQSSGSGATLRLLDLLLEAVVATRDEQKFPGQRYSSRGESLTVDVAALLWQVGYGGAGDWNKLPSVSITTHTTATVANLKSRVLEAHDVPHISKMHCEMRRKGPTDVYGGQQVRSSVSLLQAGFDSVNNKAVVRIFPETHINRNSVPLPAVGDVMTESSKYYSVLFDLVAAASAEASQDPTQRAVLERAWQLLECLPRSGDDDEKLEHPGQRAWGSELTLGGSPHSREAWEAVYRVQSINSRLRPAQVGDEPGLAEAGLTWRREFLKAGGFAAVYGLLQELASCGEAEQLMRFGLGPIMQVLEYCLMGANTDSPANLERAFSEGSQDSVKAVGYDELVAVLLKLLKQSAVGELRTYIVRTLGAVACSSEQLTSTVLAQAGALLQELLITPDGTTAAATASLLLGMCSSAVTGEAVTQVLALTTEAMKSAISQGLVERCQFALDLLLDLLGSSKAQQLEKQHAVSMAQLLKQSFADMQEVPSAKWLKLLGALASKVSPEVLDELDLTKFIWAQLYRPNAPEESARAATVSSLLQAVRSPAGFSQVVALTQTLHQPTLESVSEDLQTSRNFWFLDPDSASSLRSAKGGFCGLQNQGNTCYQNSTLQQVFMHPSLREGILSAQLPEQPDLPGLQDKLAGLKKAGDKEALAEAEAELAQATETSNRIALFKELKKLLASLKYGVTRSYNPRSFVDTAGAGKNFPFDVRMQQDASEFYALLTDRLEQAFKGSETEFKLFSEQTYLRTRWRWEAKFGEQNVSRWGGPGDMDGQMIQISLLDDMGQLVPTLDAALALKLGRPEALDGIQWDTLKDQTEDGKSPSLDSTRTMLITEAPASVVFHLTRFNPFTCEKVNDRFEFGHDLDLTSYLAPEAAERGDCGKYKLGGIVIQSGSAGGGHYYSFIRDRSSSDAMEWNRFDDSSVTPWNPEEDMETDCFGGVQLERITDRNGTTRHVKSQHWRTAYMLIYDRVDTFDGASQPADQEMSEEVRASWGSLIQENEKATARALVCNMPHLQLLLELMALSLNSEDHGVIQPMLDMALPFFFNIVVRLGKSKPTYGGTTSYTNYGTSYSSTNKYPYTNTSSYTGSTYNKPLEPEDNEELDELLWQWGQTLGTMLGSSPDASAVLKQHADAIRHVLLVCPRESTRQSIARLLVRFASMGPEHAAAAYNLLLSMLPSLERTGMFLDQFGSTLHKLLQDPELRATVRQQEGVARLLNALVPSHFMHPDDLKAITAADGQPITKPSMNNVLLQSSSHTRPAEALCDAVCALLSPVEELPAVSRDLVKNSSVSTLLKNNGSSVSEAHLVVAGLFVVGEAGVKRSIGSLVNSLVPVSVYPAKAVQAPEAIVVLLNSEWGSLAMEALVNKAQELHSTKGWNAQQNLLKTEVLVAVVAELAGTQSAASTWLEENREAWAWVGQLEPKDPVLAGTLQRLLGSTDQAAPRDPEQELIATVHEQLKTHGPYYNAKYSWCEQAVQAIGRCDPHEAVNWIIKNEVSLSAAEKRAIKSTKASEGAGAESAHNPAEQSQEALLSSWQKMVDSKLFDAAGDGDSELDEMQELLDWGANLESVHVQGRHPLHNASRNNQPKAVTFLVNAGADPSASAGDTGWTPLHNAVNFHGNKGDDYTETVRALLKGCANPHAKITENSSFRNKSPLDFAISQDKKQIEDIIRLYA